jgi:hypothetical protein
MLFSCYSAICYKTSAMNLVMCEKNKSLFLYRNLQKGSWQHSPLDKGSCLEKGDQ